MSMSIKILAAVFFLGSAIAAQELHRIAGVVTDTEGSPLAGAVIAVIGRPTATPVVADAVGAFEMSDIPSGTYTVQATLAGFRPQTQSVQLRARRVASPIKFVLRVGVLIEALVPLPEPREVLRGADAIARVRLEGIAASASCSEQTVVSAVPNASVLDVWKGKLPAKIQILETSRGACIDGDRVVVALSGLVSAYAVGSEYIVLLSGAEFGTAASA